jgi:hypothetical protein
LGNPDFDLISTSYVERLNATMRLHMKRLARLRHPFSKSARTLKQLLAFTSPITTSSVAIIGYVARLLWPLGVEQSFPSVGELLEAAA